MDCQRAFENLANECGGSIKNAKSAECQLAKIPAAACDGAKQAWLDACGAAKTLCAEPLAVEPSWQFPPGVAIKGNPLLHGYFGADFNFILIELVALGLAVLCLVHAWKTGKRAKPSTLRPFYTMLAVAVFTFIVEFKLSNDPNNSIYDYPKTWLLLLVGVPLWIPLGWAWVVYLGMATARELGMKWYYQPLMAGFLALSLDFLLDPIADLYGWWIWRGLGYTLFFNIPVSNFMAWFVIVCGFAYAALWLGRKFPAGQGWWRDLLPPVLAILPAFVAVVIFKVLSVKVVGSRVLENQPQGNGVIICFAIWAVCAYLLFRHAYVWRRDRPLDRTLFFAPLGFYALLVVYLLVRLWTDFLGKNGLHKLNEIADLVVFMPVMAALGILFFGWPYLDAIFSPRRKK